MDAWLKPFTASLDAAALKWSYECREEDLKYRKKLLDRRKIADGRRAVEEKAQMLKSISVLSALFGSFTTFALANQSFQTTLNWGFLLGYGICASLVIGFLFFSMINCTLLLIGIYGYDCTVLEQPFIEFWESKCERGWLLSFKSFLYGFAAFVAWLGHCGWVQYPYQNNGTSAAICISSIAAITGLILYFHSHAKWGNFINDPEAQIGTPALLTRAAERGIINGFSGQIDANT